jgi:hypothetical protein
MLMCKYANGPIDQWIKQRLFEWRKPGMIEFRLFLTYFSGKPGIKRQINQFILCESDSF